jgi:hypothetical protein
MSWNQPRRVIIPWMETLAQMLGRVALPIIRGRSLWVSSDYSFDNPASDFDVVGLLVADPEASGDWNYLRSEVRAKLLRDPRRMSWKNLNSDSRRQAAFFSVPEGGRPHLRSVHRASISPRSCVPNPTRWPPSLPGFLAPVCESETT